MPTLEIWPTQQVVTAYDDARDAQGQIASNPNRLDDEECMRRLIGQAITVKLVKGVAEVRFA